MKEIYVSEVLGISYEEGKEICNKINRIYKRGDIETVADLIEAGKKELEQREYELMLLLTGIGIGKNDFGAVEYGGRRAGDE
jgi:hypothetical protein